MVAELVVGGSLVLVLAVEGSLVVVLIVKGLLGTEMLAEALESLRFDWFSTLWVLMGWVDLLELGWELWDCLAWFSVGLWFGGWVLMSTSCGRDEVRNCGPGRRGARPRDGLARCHVPAGGARVHGHLHR